MSFPIGLQQGSHVGSLITHDRNEADSTYVLNNMFFFFLLKSPSDLLWRFWTSNDFLSIVSRP
jgi:hypothetical protein